MAWNRVRFLVIITHECTREGEHIQGSTREGERIQGSTREGGRIQGSTREGERIRVCYYHQKAARDSISHGKHL